jgi:Tol biopolymer transport system component/DNA-binding winged helix-turn-helix (wHTH) protein
MAPGERETTYRFGTFTINVHDRMLLNAGETVPLTPKAADTLLLLLSGPGHVFAKQEILAFLWPDSFVEEGSVARNVALLRKALGDDAEHPQFIETIPKRGYRWIAEVQTQCPSVEINHASHPAKPRLRKSVLILTCLLPALAAVAIVGLLWRTAPVPVIRPFTSYWGGEYEPAFSSDGRKIAFVWNGEAETFLDVYVRSVDSEDLTRITSDQANKGSPTWSRDGRFLAFVRYSEDQGRCGIYVVPAAGGAETRILSTSPVSGIYDRYLDWSPVADELAVVDKGSPEEPFAIYIVSLKNGARRRLTTPQAGTRGDTGPAFSRDGRYVAFRRTVSAAVNDLYVVPVLGGAPRRLTSDNQYKPAHAWSADGKYLFFSSKLAGRQGLWRIPASGGAPSQVLGGVYADFLAIAPVGDRLAYSQWSADINIWRFDLRNSRDQPQTPLIASTRNDASPQYSPQADKIAFRSDRTGTTEIWICDSEGRHPRAVTNWHGPLTGSPRWSPDGRRIAFDSRPFGKSQIFTVSQTGGTPEPITVGNSDNVIPSWSHDGHSIYFASNRSGSWQVWKVGDERHTDSDAAIQITRDGGFTAIESPDGRFVYYAKGRDSDGLWRVPSGGGREELVMPDLKRGLSGYWALRGDEILFVASEHGGPADLISLDLVSGRRSSVRRLPKEPLWTDSGFGLSPDGRWGLYAQADTSGSDIFLVEHFR